MRDIEQSANNIMIETIRKFVREKLVPLEFDVAENDRVPANIINDMKQLGLFGLTIPTEYDGLGLNSSDEARVIMELGWTSPAFRSVVGTTIGIGSQGIVMDGTEDQKKTFLPLMARGDVTASFCLTEPNAGSDAASLKTKAIKEGNYYYISGSKRYITNAIHSGILTVMARSNPDEHGAKGISAFIVDTNSDGISFGKKDEKMGQRGTVTSDLYFDRVKVPADRIIGGVAGRGFITAMKVLDRGRIHIGALCVGTAKRLIHEALSYAKEREQFGKPIAEFQLIQAMLADSQAECYAAETMVFDAARRFDQGEKITMQASCVKMFAAEMVGRVADRTVQIFGGAGYMAEYGVERFFRDVRLFRLYEGTTQIQQLIIAKEMMKN
jgi:acyl-CoA dehydrogenase